MWFFVSNSYKIAVLNSGAFWTSVAVNMAASRSRIPYSAERSIAGLKFQTKQTTLAYQPSSVMPVKAKAKLAVSKDTSD